MLILKRRYEFWFSIIALHKLGAVAIPATHLLTDKDIVYRCKSADIKAIVCVGEKVVLDHVANAKPHSPSLQHIISIVMKLPKIRGLYKGIESAQLCSS